MVECCDNFMKGSGYEFSVCGDIGAIIRKDMVGAERD
jgi:hypothetical protein